MSIFGTYAQYYNLLYKDKDYAAEADYVHNLIARYRPEGKSLLDLGCGTGRHDILLAKKGYRITGVDMSDKMLAVANSQLAALSPDLYSPDFVHGDIRTVRLGKTFDIVTSLFHVISYQVSNEYLLATFETVKMHLRPGGIFIFDCWYGPAVLTDRPVVRIKRLEDQEISVTRIAEPVMHPNKNLVDVNYHIFVRDQATGDVKELQETHRMRYLFRPEIEFLLSETGMKVIEASEWMTAKEPGFDTWGVCFVVEG